MRPGAASAFASHSQSFSHAFVIRMSVGRLLIDLHPV